MKIPGLNEEPKIGLWERFCISIASADETLLRLCPPSDLGHVKATAEILLLTMFWQATLFALISYRLFEPTGAVRPILILGSLFVAGFIMRIDSMTVIGSHWHLDGVDQIARGGLNIFQGGAARIKARAFLGLRILFSIALAQVTAVFASIIIFGGDISAESQRVYQAANANLIANTTTLVDADINRAAEAVKTETARIDALSGQVTALRQNEIDPTENSETRQAQEEVAQLVAAKAKADDAVLSRRTFATDELGGVKGSDGNSGLAGDGPRHKAAMQQIANAEQFAIEAARQLDAARARLAELRKQIGSQSDTARQQSRDTLPEFMGQLGAENRKLSSLKAELAARIAGREDAIRRAVESAPNFVPLDDGFLAQIAALEHIATNNLRIAFLIGLIDLISFALELAAVLSTVTSFIPTTYAALIAKEAYLRSVHMADEIYRVTDLCDKMPTIEFPPRNPPPRSQGTGPVSSPTPGGPQNPSPQPPKRPRGRPRKYPLN
jgi:Domain of unknown function (DUF4407)